MSASPAAIPEKLFFKIGEVCDIAGVQAHVLRYWETEFPMLQPQKNRAGQRTYRRRDVEMALRIKQLLYDEQYTIAGAKKKLAGEIRGPGRENGQSLTPRPAGRSLQPPPSLAARFNQAAQESQTPEIETSATPSGEQHPALVQIAKQLREILEILEEGDAENAAAEADRK
jgi:DNA-binding transcriptional MerR regulator